MISYDIWYDRIYYNEPWCNMLWHTTIGYDMIWYDMIWYDNMNYSIVTVWCIMIYINGHELCTSFWKPQKITITARMF